jgi:precorrin-2 dehydrogenase/sirohydrochlorin ferrochelatase
MIPLVFNPVNIRIGLAGAGASAARRLATLRAGGAEPVAVVPEAPEFAGLKLLYVTGLEPARAEALAVAARAAGVLVNVEDVPALCDFYSVAEVRRGDLLLTVSTSGAAPGLAGVIRRALEGMFPGPNVWPRWRHCAKPGAACRWPRRRNA